MGNLLLKSSAFKNNGLIPAKYTCDGEDVNPLIEILNVPEGAKSTVLIMDDPDAPAGTWDHWILWNIDPKTHYIPEDSVPGSALQGKTSFSREGYGGPCPPKGDKAHRYMFRVFALDVMLDIPEGSPKTEVLKAMEGHVLDKTVFTGLYQRK
ncbi:MAG: YbhB/YbcL family Raf kinase inhibitor-like protein [Patescibacteria group bacterium]|nr:YbhB/YbcL family Raf kinase inhibitor-like protein [Patescibacteria group bacterium]